MMVYEEKYFLKFFIIISSYFVFILIISGTLYYSKSLYVIFTDFSDLEIILPAPFHNPFNPRNVTAIYRNGGVEINWQAPQDVFHQFSHYIIQIKAHNSNWSEISVYIYPPTTSYFTQDVKSDTLYHVRVYAVDGKTYSEPSNEATVSTAVGQLAWQPTNQKALS